MPSGISFLQFFGSLVLFLKKTIIVHELIYTDYLLKNYDASLEDVGVQMRHSKSIVG